MRRLMLSACTLMMVLLAGLPARADSERLYFDAFKDMQTIGNHYDSKFGITFSSNALAVTTSLHGGIGNFTNNPSGRNVMGFKSGSGITMNVTGGFSSGLSFFYSAMDASGVVTVWDGANGTGHKLATITLAKSGNSGCSNGSAMCVWTPVGLDFSGTAKSVTFSGNGGKIGFDSVFVGNGIPSATPESSSALLLGLGLLALSCVGRVKNFFASRA